MSRTSSAMKLNRLTTFSGVPVNFLSQFRVLRAYAHRAGIGMALAHHDAAHGTSDVVPMLYSSAPIIAAITTSRPVFDAAVGAQDNPMSEAV